jgi:hypothetical protein
MRRLFEFLMESLGVFILCIAIVAVVWMVGLGVNKALKSSKPKPVLKLETGTPLNIDLIITTGEGEVVMKTSGEFTVDLNK